MAKKLPTCRLKEFEGRPLTRSGCATEKKTTICVNDRVGRKGFKAKGTVLALELGRDNRGRPRQAARVCFDTDDDDMLAYPFLFEELISSRKPGLQGVTPRAVRRKRRR